MNVDTSSPITHVSLCAGYGGIDLGLRRAIPTLRTIAVSEIEAFACANLVAKMEAGLLDPAPIWTDLKTFPWAEFRDRVDILSGGYPCQPFSAAGKRLGAEDPRHLWPHISAGIALMRPRVCFFENVEGHVSLGLPNVIEDLAGLGYRTTWGIFSASEVGAPHQRKRVFILAYRECEGLERFYNRNTSAEPAEYVGADAWASGERDAWPSRPGEQQFAWEPPRVVADTLRKQSQRGRDLGELGSPASAEQGEAQQWERSGNSVSDQGEAGTLVDAKSQRAGQRSELRSEECGSSRALSWDVEQSGEARMENSNELRLEEHGLQHAGVFFGSGRGQDAEAMGNASERKDNGRESRDLGTAPSQGRCGHDAADCTGEVLGNPDSPRPQERPRQRGAGIQGTDADGGADAGRQTQPPLGRDADGPAGGLGYAELCVSCDNRTDELRLLGNGVVPATAERAFRVLIGELMQ